MHAVSLTPHAQKIFRTTSKSENHMKNSEGMQKKLKMHYLTKNVRFRAYGVIDTACTIFAFKNQSYLGEFEAEFKKALARESV
jgi:hypothetical protein